MSKYKEQLIELFENVSGCSVDEFSEDQLPYLADYIIGQQEADNMCIEKLKKENQRLTAIATKHATLNDERYELLLKQKSDIEKMLDQLFKHDKVDAWLVCKMNDMLDDVNHQLDKSRTEVEGE
ncbi:hypothetical protein V039C_0068 [Vibrio phage V039C]|nr:hypothetical protein V039C_0068 [Vibrio phage V039C]